jgi:hypothetical protein
MNFSKPGRGLVGCALQRCGLLRSPGLAPGFPRVELVHADLTFDRVFGPRLNAEIDPSWAQEIRAKTRSFQQFWDQEAPLLLGTTVAEIGTPFRNRDATAVLTLCPIPSMSVPLLLNVRRFLDGPTQGNPQPMFLFSGLVFHELLHPYIGRYDRLESRLVEKYSGEPLVVLTHLHLTALMKGVYLKLGRADQLREIVARDSAAEDPAYRRAWQIVNDIEGHEAFVIELKSAQLGRLDPAQPPAAPPQRK